MNDWYLTAVNSDQQKLSASHSSTVMAFLLSHEENLLKIQQWWNAAGLSKSSVCICVLSSVCPNLLLPHGLKHTRFLHAWAYPDKNTRIWVAISSSRKHNSTIISCFFLNTSILFGFSKAEDHCHSQIFLLMVRMDRLGYREIHHPLGQCIAPTPRTQQTGRKGWRIGTWVLPSTQLNSWAVFDSFSFKLLCPHFLILQNKDFLLIPTCRLFY